LGEKYEAEILEVDDSFALAIVDFDDVLQLIF
jgi:hypothetical protein